ncbi:unknown protein [Waddlia chondrophila 2032/99]|uniref:Uncharacterized protein n=1 Tax=Waddlia chondrophila 2032/99 TaxID=765953 RepID=F8L9Z0_9BACT|nr:unknown protein [Waddlia chondrophila 2032/99]
MKADDGEPDLFWRWVKASLRKAKEAGDKEPSEQQEWHVQRPGSRREHCVLKAVTASVMELIKQYSCSHFLPSVSPNPRHFSTSSHSPDGTCTVLGS